MKIGALLLNMTSLGRYCTRFITKEVSFLDELKNIMAVFYKIWACTHIHKLDTLLQIFARMSTRAKQARQFCLDMQILNDYHHSFLL